MLEPQTFMAVINVCLGRNVLIVDKIQELIQNHGIEPVVRRKCFTHNGSAGRHHHHQAKILGT